MPSATRFGAALVPWMLAVMASVAMLSLSACFGGGSAVDNPPYEPPRPYYEDPEGLQINVQDQTVRIGERPAFRIIFFRPGFGQGYFPDGTEYDFWWQRDGVDITSPNPLMNELTLAPAVPADNGARIKSFALHRYTGKILTGPDAVLTVTNELLPLSIRVQPANLTVGDRESAAFDVAVEGGLPTYQWLRNGVPIPGAVQASFELAQVAFADNGAKFSVVVSNALGSVTSNEATLTVIDGALQVARHAGGIGGAGNADGAGLDLARFDSPMAVARDQLGNVYVADTLNGLIRRIDPAGVVTVVAGSRHEKGHRDGFGDEALFTAPAALAMLAGTLYVADWNHTIRRIVGPHTAAPLVTTVAGRANEPGAVDGVGDAARFNAPSGLAFDSEGRLYVADEASHTIRRIDVGTREVTTYAGRAFQAGSDDGNRLVARFRGPRGLHMSVVDGLSVADTGNHAVRHIDRLGQVITVAGTAGVAGYRNGPAAQALFSSPTDLVQMSDSLYVADRDNHVIRNILGGQVRTGAGTGMRGSNDGQPEQAQFDAPTGLADGGSDQLLIADLLNHAIRVLPVGASALPVTTLAGQKPQPGASDGHWAVARFCGPGAVAGASRDALLIADSANHTLRRLAGSAVSTLAGAAGHAATTDGTGAQARFDLPVGIAIDGDVAWVTQNGAVRRVDAGGTVQTLVRAAASNGLLQQPHGIAVDATGHAYVSDRGTHRIVRISAAGDVTEVAGGGVPGRSDGTGGGARFDTPSGIAVDRARNLLYVADSGNHTIRRVHANGVVETLAGAAGDPGRADGAGAAARFRQPSAVAVGRDGNVYVADRGNHTIRRITPDGQVTTIAGEAGVAGFKPGALPALFARPEGIAAIGTSLFVTMEHGVVEVRSYP